MCLCISLSVRAEGFLWSYQSALISLNYISCIFREEQNLKDSNGYQSNNAPAYAHNVHVPLLPPFLFTSYSLKQFTLTSIVIRACNITPKTPWDFPALTTLHIRGIVLCGGMTIEKGKKWRN